MSKSGTKRIVEWIKTALIALLTASSLLLCWRTGLFDEVFRGTSLFGNFAELVRSAGTGTADQGRVAFKEAARPMGIVITFSDGSRYGVKYDTVSRNAVYDRTSSILGEALGSASAPTEINEDEWRSALDSPGFYFEYMTSVRLSILDGWLGARLPDTVGDVALRRVFVAFGEERGSVYYQDAENGTFFCAETESSTAKAQELEIFSPNGALFAFETGIESSANAPYMLILP